MVEASYSGQIGDRCSEMNEEIFDRGKRSKFGHFLGSKPYMGCSMHVTI